MSPANKQPASLTTTLVLFNTLALLLVAMWFRCRALDAIPGINGDEAWYGVQAWELLHGGRPSLHTPTGNLLNPFFCGPLLLLQACFPPSIVVLRAVSLLSGLLALAVNWWLCRWVFDHRTALVSTLGLAVLPIDIAYSRFAWDASQSLLATLPVLYLSLAAVRFPARHERLTALAILALVVAVVVHPTNILAGAAIAAALAMRWRQLRASPRSLLLVVLALLALVIWKTCLIKAPAMDFAQRVEQLHELASPARWSRAAILYGQLFSGETIYQYIPGTHSWLDWPALGGQGPWAIGTLLPWAVLLAAAWGLWRTAVREAGKGDSPVFVGRKLGQSPGRKLGQSPDGSTVLATDRALVAAWLLQLAGFMLLAGPRALEPGQERYALCLLAPAIVLAARAAAVLSMRSRRWQWLTLVTAALAAWFFLADYQQHYFRCFDETGGAAHKTFRTAVIEPKRAALDYIVKHREPGVTWIVTPAGRDGYWSYWPLRYLALAEHDIRVVMVDEAASQAELPRAWADGRVWFVRYDDDAPQWPAFVTAAPAGRGLHRQYICDNGGRSALVLLNAASATGSR